MRKKLLIFTLLASLSLVVSGCFAKPQTPTHVNQNTNTATTTEEIDTSEWKTYRNEEYEFEIKYPKDWAFRELREGTKIGEEDIIKPVSWVIFDVAGSGGGEWGVQFFHNSNELEQDIARIGNQFEDRKEFRKEVTFNNIDALFVVVATDKYKDWVSESVYFSKDGLLFRIGNGAVQDNKFEKFYNSFRFIVN